MGLVEIMIALGVAVSLLSAMTYRPYLTPSDGRPGARPIWSMAVVVAILLGALGVIMVCYLLATSF